MTETPRTDAVLSYGQAEPKTRKILLRLFWAALIIAIASGAFWKIFPEANRRLKMLSAQRRLMNASAPPVEAFIHTSPPDGKFPPSMDVIGEGGHGIRDMDGGSLFEFREACRAPSMEGKSTIYSHSISDCHGNVLIVTVEIFPFAMGTPHFADYPSRLIVNVLTPGTLFSYPSQSPIVVRPFQFDGFQDLPLRAPLSFKIFNGQPDPADASHFTIDYELNGQRHTLDGFIDDQDVLKIEKRKEQ